MMYNLLSDGSPSGLSTGALVALIICGVVVLALAIFGTILRSRDLARGKNAKKQSGSRAKKGGKSDQAKASIAVEKHYDFTHLTEEEKNLIRRHRDQQK